MAKKAGEDCTLILKESNGGLTVVKHTGLPGISVVRPIHPASTITREYALTGVSTDMKTYLYEQRAE